MPSAHQSRHANLLTGLCPHFDDAFLSVAVKRGIANGILDRKMDEVSVDALLSSGSRS